jgi:hypothetical protein
MITLAIITLFAGLATFSLSTPRNAKLVRSEGFQPRTRLLLKIAASLLLLMSLGTALAVNAQLGALYWCAGFAACGLAMTAFYSAQT